MPLSGTILEAHHTPAAPAVESWLRRTQRVEVVLNATLGVCSLAFSVVVLALTAWVTFFVVLMLLIRLVAAADLVGLRVTLPRWTASALTLGFLALLFAGNARTSREYLGQIPRVTWWSSPLGPEIWRTSAKLATDCLFSGPRLVNTAFGGFAKSVRLARLDVEPCARVLAALCRRDGRVSFLDLAALLPASNPVRVFPQLRDIEGVVFLTMEPVGLSLTAELRQELRRLIPQTEETAGAYAEEEPEQTFEPPPSEAHRVLDVSGRATASEIKAAYRRRMKECHPDRFAGMGEEMLRLAEEQAKTLNAAYANLTARPVQENS